MNKLEVVDGAVELAAWGVIGLMLTVFLPFIILGVFTTTALHILMDAFNLKTLKPRLDFF